MTPTPTTNTMAQPAGDINTVSHVNRGGGAGLVRDRRVWIILAICLAYLGLQVAYVLRLPLVMDEMSYGVYLQTFLQKVPYRDFVPYKTVLGYYIECLPLLVFHGTWHRFMAVKLELACINAAAVFLMALALKRMVGFHAACAAILLVVSMSTFMERSSALRVDMLTSWFTVASLLLLLNRRYVWAGVACGLSALICQKAILHGIACGAYFACGLLVLRDPKFIRYGLRFGLAAAAVLAGYILFWSLFAPIRDVVLMTFYNASQWRHAATDMYSGMDRYWLQTISRNPLFWGLALLALMRLVGHWWLHRENNTHPLMTAYAIGLLGIALWYKQPWPYFFVLIIPQMAVLIAVMLSIEMAGWHHWLRGERVIAVIVFVMAGLVLPALRIGTVLQRDSSHQRYSIGLAERLLDGRQTYYAAIPMLYGHRQTPAEWPWLDQALLNRLNSLPKPEIAQLVDEMRRSHLKLYIENYRTRALPSKMRAFLEANYEHLSGNVCLYAPSVSPGRSHVAIQFKGRYRIEGATPAGSGSAIAIAGKSYHIGDHVDLDERAYDVRTDAAVRFKLLPKVHDENRPEVNLFNSVYSY